MCKYCELKPLKWAYRFYFGVKANVKPRHALNRDGKFLTDYMVSDVQDCLNCLDFELLVFTLGYPKAGDTERRLTFKNPHIRIGTGRPEWGAEPGKNYFVITWEE